MMSRRIWSRQGTEYTAGSAPLHRIAQARKEILGREHFDIVMAAEIEKISVAGHDLVGIDGGRAGDHDVVVWIAHHARDIGISAVISARSCSWTMNWRTSSSA
jgi:hypothetical protein